jgi:hypothetical protein
MISLELQKKLELWSMYLTLILMGVAFLLFIYVYVTTIRIEGKSELRANKYINYKPFGVARQEDIWMDDRNPNNKYTAHGRLISGE